MRLSRIITAVAVGLAVASLPTAAATAQPVYPPQLPTLTLSDSTVQVGETVVITGNNFGPNEIVDITITVNPLAARAPGATTRGSGTTVSMAMVPVTRQLPQWRGPVTLQAVTDANGAFRVSYRVRYPGEYTITAVGRESGLVATATLIVLGGRQLPVTGAGVGPQLAVGGGLLATGVLLVLLTVLWRRRSRRGAMSEYEAVH